MSRSEVRNFGSERHRTIESQIGEIHENQKHISRVREILWNFTGKNEFARDIEQSRAKLEKYMKIRNTFLEFEKFYGILREKTSLPET